MLMRSLLSRERRRPAGFIKPPAHPLGKALKPASPPSRCCRRSRPKGGSHDIHREQAEQAVETVDPKPNAFLASRLLDLELVHGLGNGRERPLVHERLAAHMPHELQRPAPEILEGVVADRSPVGGELIIGRNDRHGIKGLHVLGPEASRLCGRQSR